MSLLTTPDQTSIPSTIAIDQQQYLVEVGEHVALALDGALPQADKHA